MKKDHVLAPIKEQESKRLWEPMALTPVGNLDAIQNSTGSVNDTPLFMMGSSDLALKQEVRPLRGALGCLKAIRTA